MRYLKTYKVFESIQTNPRLYKQILGELGYYSTDDENLLPIADKLYHKNCKGVFLNSKVNNMDYLKDPDTSCKLVYHSSNENFDVFKTPAFFGSGDGYRNDGITYNCILNMTKPLDLRYKKANREEWYNLLEDIFKNDKDCEQRLKAAREYGDSYGFFKLLFNSDDDWGAYRWDLIYDYVNKNGYDGVIYRESDSSIQWYFDGFLVMKPSQIKIVFKWDDDKKEIIDE